MSTSTRRNFLAAAAILTTGTAAAAVSLPDLSPVTPMKKKFPVVHHVFFWLKNPASATDRDQLIAGVKTLAKIETVGELRVGVVATTEKREVVDNSWAVSELMFFEDLEGQAVYQTHPLHLEFIKNCSHLWEKVVVYDALDV